MDSKGWVEVQAPTVEEAIILGLTRLGITREDAAVQVIEEGSQGFLGLGAREARVRVSRREEKPSESKPAAQPTPLPAEPTPSPETETAAEQKAPVKTPEATAPRSRPRKKPSAEAKAPSAPQPEPKPKKKPRRERRPVGDSRKEVEAVVLDVGSHLFGALDVQPKLTWREEDRRPALWLSLEGEDAEALIGRHGETLNAAQFLTRVLVRNEIDGNFNLIVDAADYRWQQYHQLEQLAQKMAQKAVSSGQPVRLRPMPARERRIIHMTLRDDERVRTKSYGSGRGRAVTIFPVSSDSR